MSMGISKKDREKTDRLMANPLEHWEQVQVCKWLDENGIEYHANPNGAYFGEDKKGSKIRMQKLKDEGFRAGVYDLFIMEPRYGHHGCYLEMKRLIGTGESPKQRRFRESAEAKGYHCVVCRGHKNAIDALRDYLGIEDDNLSW